jgi:peptide/nickel transport system substrate-binding protein
MTTRSAPTALVSLALVVLAACAAPERAVGSSARRADQEAQAPKRMIGAIMGNPSALSTKLSSGSGGKVHGADVIENLINVGLAIEDTQGVLQPRLGEAVPTVENGLWKVFPDGRMETTWKIRPGAGWHDGALFTAGDLVFSARVAQDPDLPEFRERDYEILEMIDAPDPQTVLVKWKRPYIDANLLFSRAPIPKHIFEPSYTQDKASFRDHASWTDGYVGTGPFKLREWARGSHVVLTANRSYILGRPNFDEIEVRFIPDANTLMANILAGTVEIVLGLSVSLEQAVQLRDQWQEGSVQVLPDAWELIFPQFYNPSPPVVADVRLRRALMHALDRQEMADLIQAGFVPVAHSHVNPTLVEHRAIESFIVRYEYDPRKAVVMIEELGYTRGADGGFRDSAGQKLSLEVQTLQTLDINLKTMFAVADYWQRVGVAPDPVVVPQQRSRDIEYRANFPAFSVQRQPNNLQDLARYHGSEARLPQKNYVGTNYARYINPEFDALIDRYFTTIPWHERMQVLGQMVRHQTDQLTAMGLFYDTQSSIIGNRLLQVGPGSRQAWNGHEWDKRS